MRHYPFHVGDYRSATAHLTDAEDLAYRRLLDHYYDTEQPIALDLVQVGRRLRIDPLVAAAVLADFFVERVDGWHHVRCDEELEKYHDFANSGRRGAEKRWGKQDRQPIGTLSNPNSPPNAPLLATKNQEPRTVNQEPEPRTKTDVPPLVLVSEQPKSKPLQPAAPAAQKKKVSPADETALQAVCRETWAAYSGAYQDRYSVDPVRNAKINGQVKQFCQRIPSAEAPHIAAFYVRHNASYYVGKGHAVGLLLADAEKLRTEWATNRTMTATQAQQADKTQANGNVWNKVIDEIKERERNEAIQQAQ